MTPRHEVGAGPVPVHNAGSGDRGFSLVELLVSSTIMIAVLGTIVPIFTQANQMYRIQRQFIDARGNTSASIDMMARMIRQARTITPDPDGNLALDSIQLVSDWNPRDGDTNDPYETITFSTAGGQLMKREPGDAAPVPFADRIQSLTFVYRNAVGTQLATPWTAGQNQLAFVEITVVTPPVEGRPGITMRTSTSVRRRE